MNDLELRALVREAIARQLGSAPMGRSASATGSEQHFSHVLIVLPTGSDGEGPCLIEPSVPCTHCGYCKSYGH